MIITIIIIIIIIIIIVIILKLKIKYKFSIKWGIYEIIHFWTAVVDESEGWSSQ